MIRVEARDYSHLVGHRRKIIRLMARPIEPKSCSPQPVISNSSNAFYLIDMLNNRLREPIVMGVCLIDGEAMIRQFPCRNDKK